jgi:hypothetical protein
MKLSVTIATKDELETLPQYDHTKLSAINTCPTWGIIRYTHHKTLQGVQRAMALEAGAAAHDGFAAVRLSQLGFVQNYPKLMHLHGARIFGQSRWEKIFGTVKEGRTPLSNTTNMAIEAFLTSGFFDDEKDRRRTSDNIIEALIEYSRQWDMNRHRIWIRDPFNDQSDVGIEIPFAMTVATFDTNVKLPRLVYTGKIDGIHVKTDDRMIIHENKSGSRIDEAWLAQWRMSHQITGYCIAAGAFTDKKTELAEVIGMQIPLPKSVSDGIKIEQVPRDDYKVEQWANWLFHTVALDMRYKNIPLDAPRYTHSCNRYFRPCSFIALCDQDRKEQEKIYAEMIHEEWSPLEDTNKVMG